VSAVRRPPCRRALATSLVRRGMDDTASVLERDRQSLQRSTSAMENYLARIPVMGSLMSSIRDRRFRNQLILASVIAACVFFFLWFFFLRHLPASDGGEDTPARIQ
jgi:hypothetical protein